MRLPLHPSLAELSALRVRLEPSDATTIAREVILRVVRGDLPGIPSAHIIRLTDDGAIQVEGPIASGREIERGARLLESLLPPLDARIDVRVPGAMRLVIARALRVLDLPPFESLQAFADALHRFETDDVAQVVSRLVTTWRVVAPAVYGAGADLPMRTVAEPAELTISDIRRARRATRLTLADISERSRIPVDLLRELEWGYLVNWPPGFNGRAQLGRYARAAGLDEHIVMGVALPLLEECDLRRPPEVTVEVVDEVVDEPFTVMMLPPATHVEARPVARRRWRWAAALAVPALLAVGLIPAFWFSSGTDGQPASPAVQVSSAATPPAAAPVNTTPKVKVADGLLPRPVDDSTAFASVAFSPAFATAGSAVFYHSDRGARSAIVKADTDSSGAVLRVTRVVDDGASNFHARPSPDGSLIAFDSDRDGERGVYVADAEGRDLRRVSGEGFAAVPSWSPDGKTIAFVRAEEHSPRVWNIWTVDLETDRQSRLTSHRLGQPWGAAWFPDGKTIAYSREDRLTIRSLDGRRQSVFHSPIRGRMLRTPAVSPDGRHVIFQVHRNGAWLLNVATGRMRKVLADPTAEEFTWSPDGLRVAYHSRRTGKWGVRVLDASALSAAAD